jgi:hypothetical protein
MRCPISFIPWSELEHPAVFRNQKALVVYDAAHIVTWLRTSRRNPVTNEVLNPFTPLKELLLSYRLPHTTDVQFAQTHRLLAENESRMIALQSYASAIQAHLVDLVISVVNMALTPLAMVFSILLTIGVFTVVSEAVCEVLMRLVYSIQKECPDMRWPLSVLDVEAIVRAHSKAVVVLNFIYVRFIHPCVLFVIHLYFGSEFSSVLWVGRWWCEGLVVFRASPLFQNATAMTGVDVLLLACE